MFFFKSMVSKFAFWSIVLLILVVLTAVKSVWNGQNSDTPEFTSWQAQYRTVSAALAQSDAVKEAALDAPTEVKQVTVLQFPVIKSDGTEQQRVDRCQSCHVGLGNPSMTAENIIKVLDNQVVPTDNLADYLNDPAHAKTLEAIKTLGAHPGIRVESGDNPHDLGVIRGAKFTYGIVTEASLSDEDKSDYQYQKINLKQHPFPTFGCTTCHYGTGRELIQDSAHGSPEHSLTPLLAAKYMEAACAQCHARYDEKSFAIGYQAPLSASHIIKLLDGKDVTADQVQSYIGDPKNAQTAATIQYVAGQPQMATIAHGEQLFKAQACYGCHKIEGFSKGNVGPELTNEGRAAGGTTAIAHQIWDPRYKVASCVMPYFFALRQHNYDDTDELRRQEIVDPRTKTATPAPVTVKDSPEYEEDIATTLRQHGYIADASRQADVDALVTFVASQTGQNYADSQASRFTTIAAYNVARPADVTASAVVGKQLFEQSGCYACHYIGNPDKAHQTGDPNFGKGGVAGPELSWEGTRHSQKWMVEHYKNPQAFVPGSIMPIFSLSDSQRAALSLYDGSLRPSKSTARPVSPDQDLPPGYKDQE
jgi:cbb3-type cytochrome oxidase cytochrome c subunit